MGYLSVVVTVAVFVGGIPLAVVLNTRGESPPNALERKNEDMFTETLSSDKLFSLGGVVVVGMQWRGETTPVALVDLCAWGGIPPQPTMIFAEGGYPSHTVVVIAWAAHLSLALAPVHN